MGGTRLAARQGSSDETRRALLIGVASYEAGEELNTPLRDVSLLRGVLERRGFICDTVLDPDLLRLVEAVDAFSARLPETDLGLIFFAGHAYEHAGDGAVLPVDFPFPPNGARLNSRGFRVAEFEDAFRRCRGAGVLILDACRIPLENAAERHRWAEGAGTFDTVSDHRELLVAWSTSAGAPAWDGIGDNSLFAATLARFALRHDLDLDGLFKAVAGEVNDGPHAQRAWYRSSLTRPHTLSDLPHLAPAEVVPTHLPARAGPLWLSRNADGTCLLACGGSKSLVEVRQGRCDFIPTARMTAAIAADWTADGVAVADDTPALRLRGVSDADIPLDFDPHGVRTDPSGTTLLAWGEQRIELFSLAGRRPLLKRSWRPRWSAYGAAFQDAKTGWIVGSNGNIAKLDAAAGRLVPMTLENTWAGHLNDVLVLENGDLVVVGNRGGLRRLRPQSGAADHLPALTGPEPDRPPGPLAPALALVYARTFGDFHILFCDAAPDVPLLAAATDGGDVLLIDARDGAEVRRIRGGAGPETLEGLAFRQDGVLAVLGRDAAVRFFRQAAS
jgi:hypothetical protein